MNLNISKLKAIIFTFILLTAVFAGWSAEQVNAQRGRCANGENRVTAAIFGQFGISIRQTVQLNVVNFHPQRFDPDDPMYPPDPTRPVPVELRIMDREGNVVARRRTRLAPGSAVSLQVNGEIFADDGNRADLRALVIFLNPGGQFRPSLIVPTLEVVNNDTAVTSMFIHPASIVGFNPQPEPPA